MRTWHLALMSFAEVLEKLFLPVNELASNPLLKSLQLFGAPCRFSCKPSPVSATKTYDRR
jgi:hypothetical protein